MIYAYTKSLAFLEGSVHFSAEVKLLRVIRQTQTWIFVWARPNLLI